MQDQITLATQPFSGAMKIKLLCVLMALMGMAGCGSPNIRNVRKEQAPSFLETKSKANGGNAAAQNDLAVIYRDGLGVKQDFDAALKWFRKAAKQNQIYSQNSLGVMYEKGQGVPRNYEEAVKWYHKAAVQGLAAAQHNLGLGFAKGQGVEQNLAQADAWFTIASTNGVAEAEKAKGIFRQVMSPENITKAEALAKEMIQKNSKLINLTKSPPTPLLPQQPH